MLTHATPHFLNKTTPTEEIPSTGAKLASSLGLMIVADNRFVCLSSEDLWAANGEGIKRLSSDEVDHGESLEAADSTHPEAFLASLLSDLDF